MEGIETLQRWMDESSRIVFFGGAGVSTESGIPDFRSVDGLYHQQYQYPPETILSRSFFDRQPEEFYRFYRSKMLCLDAKPNAAHKKLAELERGGRLRSVVTQKHRRPAPGGWLPAGVGAPRLRPAQPVYVLREALAGVCRGGERRRAPLYLRGSDQARCGAL